MLICKYKGYAQSEIETDGTNYTITLVHDLGEKWSKFLRYVIEEGMKSTVGIVPKFDLSQGSLMVTFSV
jgi:ethanolamine utilization protein EutP (predicted NTPase)